MIVKLMCFFTLIFGGFMTQNNNFENLSQSFNSASEIIITHNNKNLSFNKGDQKFQDIVDAMMDMLNGAHDMPAFGVSLDEETRKARTTGLWIEFVFDCEKSYNEMLFESLLIEINKDYSGFNINRKYNGKYEGRCFYYNLNGDMSSLDNVVRKIIENKI